MESKKSIKFWICFIVFMFGIIWGAYEIVSCSPIFSCTLNWFKFILITLMIIIGAYGMFITRNNEPNIKDLIELKEE